MAADASQVTKRQRQKRFAPKVRSGCITCKIRRVKCDETKPNCIRCTSTGRKCDGYAPLPKTVSFEVSTDPAEKWSFHYFCERTARHVTSFSEHGLWDRLVLQASYSSEVVRRLVTAIGAYHEAVDLAIQDRSSTQQQFATRQYNRAISRFIPQLIEMPTETVLLVSIVLAFFENIRGNLDAAVRHLYAALAILAERRNTKISPSSSMDLIDRDLAPILDSLHISAATSMPVFGEAQGDVDTPDEFDSLVHAHTAFYQTVQSISEKIDAAFQQAPDKEYSKDFQSMARGTLDAWRIAFEKLKTRRPYHKCQHGNASKTHFDLGIGHLDSQYLSSSIRLDAALNGSEMTFDHHHAEFKQIVNICQSMISNLQPGNSSDADHVECLEFNPTYIPTLAFVAMKCRDPTIRRTAIETLRSLLRSETEWNSFFMADVSEFLMSLEEGKASDQHPVSASDLPETVRLQLVFASVFSFDPATQRFKFSYEFQNPQIVKLNMLRKVNEFSEHQFSQEDYWLDRRKTKIPRLGEDAPYPQVVIGLFPQVQQSSQPTNLWAPFKTAPPTKFLSRALLNQIFTAPVDRREPKYMATWKTDHGLETRKKIIGQLVYYTKI